MQLRYTLQFHEIFIVIHRPVEKNQNKMVAKTQKTKNYEGMQPTTKSMFLQTVAFFYARRRHEEVWIQKSMFMQLSR